jgi:hypothetical protein
VVPEAAVVAVESAPAIAATMSPRVGRCGDRRQKSAPASSTARSMANPTLRARGERFNSP